MLALTTVERLFPIWLLLLIVVLEIIRRSIRSSVSLGEFSVGRVSRRVSETVQFTAIGGMRCQWGPGTFTATKPLARLTCFESELRIGPSIRLIGWMMPD